MRYIIATVEKPHRFVKWGIDSIYLTAITERNPKQDALRIDGLRRAEWYKDWAQDKYPHTKFSIIRV